MSEHTLAPGYSTGAAVDGAWQRGFDLSGADWRAVFLAITDHFATDGKRCDRDHVAAEYVGQIRDGMERWTISFSGRQFDALYDPFRAVVYRVVDGAQPLQTMIDAQPPPDPPSLSAEASSASLVFSA